MTKVTSRKTSMLVAALFVATPSIAMAQAATANPGSTAVNTYSGPAGGPGPSYPVEVTEGGAGYYAGAVAGNGAAGVTAGSVNSNGQVSSVNAATGLPGEPCMLLPGTDIPYDCPSQ